MNNSATIHAAEINPVNKLTRHYMLTCDLEDKLKLLELAGIIVPPAAYKLMADFQRELGSRIGRLLPKTEIRTIHMSDMAERIITTTRSAEHWPNIESCFFLSTCSEIAGLIHGFTLEINRITDTFGHIIGVGPRPGFPALSDQIKSLVQASGGQPIVIMEDGIFTGESLAQIINLIKENGGKVSGVVAGFAFPKGETAVKIALGKEGHLVTTEATDHLVDWVPDHDFIPFMPNCGRVVGISWSNHQGNGSAKHQVYPFYSHDGYTWSTPYLLPFCPMNDWTGINIPGDSEELRWLSEYCIEQTSHLFEELAGANGRRLMLSDLKKVRPPVSAPFQIGNDPMIGTATLDILEYLSQVKQKIWE